MKFRVSIPGLALYPGGVEHWHADLPGSEVVRMAKRADELGFDILRVPEHIVMQDDWVPVMGPRWPHALATAGVLAGATERIRIVPIFILPYHQPVGLAKGMATIDHFSDGRFAFLAAVGYMQWENDLMDGPPYKERGKVVDEYLDAFIELWTAEHPEFDGTYVQFKDIAFDPKPAQKPYPPIWIAGNSNAAVRRAARIGDGWSPNGISRARLREKLAWIKEQPSFQGRGDRPFEVYLNLFEGEINLDTHEVIKEPEVSLEPEVILEQCQQLADIGVTYTDCEAVIGSGTFVARGDNRPPVASVDDFMERIQWFAEEILPEAARITPATSARV